MKIRFAFELAVGMISVAAVLLLGSVGMVFFALFAFFPLVVRKYGSHKPDERELQLFYRAGNLTLVLIFLAVLGIYLASSVSINGRAVGENWYLLTMGAILATHGFAGLISFR
jgi:hypothetical protein